MNNIVVSLPVEEAEYLLTVVDDNPPDKKLNSIRDRFQHMLQHKYNEMEFKEEEYRKALEDVKSYLNKKLEDNVDKDIIDSSNGKGLWKRKVELDLGYHSYYQPEGCRDISMVISYGKEIGELESLYEDTCLRVSE